MTQFARLDRLPPYVFTEVNKMKKEARRAGQDIVDLGMGNPDLPPPTHILDKLIEAAGKGHNHRYSASMGITKLREAIAGWYRRRFDVKIDPDTEAIVTIGVKEGISHLVLVTIRPGDVVLAPNPAYPIHHYSAIIAGGDVCSIPLGPGRDFFRNLLNTTRQTWPRPKLLLLNYPHNPTTEVVELDFFQKIVDFAKEHNILVIHDFAYADLVYDGYRAPSILQAKGAKDVAVEFFSMSKSYSMAGWRIGYCVGNRESIFALRRIKSYLDYGIFLPMQIAAITALNGPQECVDEINETYRLRRDTLITGLSRAGWEIESPKGTMFVWARIPEKYQAMGSVEFSKFLIREARVAVSPGVGFGEHGGRFVRFALIENSMRINQAVRGIRKVLTSDQSPQTGFSPKDNEDTQNVITPSSGRFDVSNVIMLDRKYTFNPDRIDVWYANIKTCRMLCLENLLSADELDRARRYHFEADANRFVTARGMLRKVLSRYLHQKPHDIMFEYDLNGKPGLKGEGTNGVQFNVSHSGDKVIIALARGRRVGVDVEQVNDAIQSLDLARSNFSSREVAALEKSPDEERAKMFYRIWTRKEAILKAVGVGLGGLSQSLDLIDGCDVSFHGIQWKVLDLDIAQGYAAALAVEGSICDIRILSEDRE